MILIIKTDEKGRTEVTDDRGNAFATLYGVKKIEHDGVISVELSSSKVIGEQGKDKVLSSASGAITKPSVKKKMGRKGNS